MKAKIAPNAELEFVSPDELRTILRQTLSGLRRPSQIIRPFNSVALDGSGNANGNVNGCAVYEVPMGYEFILHRLEVFPEGYTFGVPYTSSTGYLDIMRGEHRHDGINFTAPGLPSVWSGGTEDGVLYRNGEVVRIDFFGGPPSKNVIIRAQGTLQAIVADDPPE